MRARALRVARRVWWAASPGLRDTLRPVLFGSGGIRGAAAGVLGRARAEPAWRRLPKNERVGPEDAAPNELESTVSVVIPTLDAGPLFDRVLGSLSSQVGLREVELIVLDSGSGDGTPDRAQAAGATVIPIAPDEFGHGRTRNRGAELAGGSVVVMLAQDAVLLGRQALRTLVQELERDSALAAVSARQVPRSDADLYAAYVIHAHELVRRDAAGGARGPFGSLAPVQRRAVAAVDDVCAALRRTAWEELRFADVEFGEDVDFGVRAVESGWRVAVHEVAAVAHSHTRGAVYCLRRSAADRIAVAPLVGDGRATRAASAGVRAVAGAGRLLCLEVAGAVDRLDDAPLATHLRVMCDALRKRPGVTSVVRGELAELLAFLPSADEAAALDRTLGHLRDDLVGVLGWPPLSRFAAAQPCVAAEAAATFVAKMAGAVVGQAIGDAVRLRGDVDARAWLLAGV